MPANMKDLILLDPLEHKVCLPPRFNKLLVISDHTDKDLSLVIERPAMIILEHSKKHLYHLRSVSWEATILFKSEQQEECWMVCECVQNPEPTLFGALLEKGQVVFSVANL
jgi:hypothetical protein